MKILATSGGFLPTDLGPYQWRRGPLIEHAFELAGNPERPRFCYLGTACGDNILGTAGVYRAFAGVRRAGHAPRAVLDAQRRPTSAPTCSRRT